MEKRDEGEQINNIKYIIPVIYINRLHSIGLLEKLTQLVRVTVLHTVS